MRPEPFRLKLDWVEFNFRFKTLALASLIKWWLSVLGQLRLIRSISISLLEHLDHRSGCMYNHRGRVVVELHTRFVGSGQNESEY